MIITMMSEGALLEEQARDECIEWLVDKELNYLKTLNERRFKEWVREMIEDQFDGWSTTDLELFINLMKEKNND